MTFERDSDSKPELNWHNFFVATVLWALGQLNLVVKVVIITLVVKDVWY